MALPEGLEPIVVLSYLLQDTEQKCGGELSLSNLLNMSRDTFLTNRIRPEHYYYFYRCLLSMQVKRPRKLVANVHPSPLPPPPTLPLRTERPRAKLVAQAGAA